MSRLREVCPAVVPEDDRPPVVQIVMVVGGIAAAAVALFAAGILLVFDLAVPLGAA